jgi:hypothetical protein
MLLGYAGTPEPAIREGIRLLASVPALAPARKRVDGGWGAEPTSASRHKPDAEPAMGFEGASGLRTPRKRPPVAHPPGDSAHPYVRPAVRAPSMM